MEQDLVWNVSILLIVANALVFIFVVSKSGDRVEYAGIQTSGYRIRSIYFWVLIIVGAIATFYTLGKLPYGLAAANAGKVQVVKVQGFQWYWEISQETVKANQPVEFQVTANDVTHGMGIYDSSLRLITQVQAMPGFTNHLVHTFTEPGVYKLLCLEYCGLTHNDMTAELTVLANPSR